MKKTTKIEKQFLKESNAIEGVYLEYSLKCAMEAWEFLKSQKELTVEVVLKVHYILMQGTTLDEKYIGCYRDCNVWIGGRLGLFPEEIRNAMDSWLEDVKTSIKVPGKNGSNIQRDHIEYERIHPFADGNGRTGRMFMNWQRLQAGLPVLVIKESTKYEKYYPWFR